MGSLMLVQITDLHLINDDGPKLILCHLTNLGAQSIYAVVMDLSLYTGWQVASPEEEFEIVFQ